MNVLVTGGAGYIGSHTVIALAEAGYTPIIFDNFSNSNRSVTNALEAVIGKSIKLIEGDIRDQKLLESVLKGENINQVIHFAGLKSVQESFADPLKYYDVNVVGSLCLIEAMNVAGVKRLVFSSSATVYGEPELLPYDENHSLNPINPYGRTKLQVEQILIDLVNSKNALWSCVILRYFNPLGAHSSGSIGEDPQGVPNNLMPYLLRVASGRFDSLSIFGNDYPTKDGSGERDYIHVMDLASGHLLALDFIKKNHGVSIFNLGTGKPVSVFQLISEFEAATGIKIPYQIKNRRNGDLATYFADPRKANMLLGWHPKHSIEEMCLSSWAYAKKLID